jgi:hypothetical protein
MDPGGATRLDIGFGLKKVTIPGFRKALKEEDRFASPPRLLGTLSSVAGNSSGRPNPFNKETAPGWVLLRPPHGKVVTRYGAIRPREVSPKLLAEPLVQKRSPDRAVRGFRSQEWQVSSWFE